MVVEQTQELVREGAQRLGDVLVRRRDVKGNGKLTSSCLHLKQTASASRAMLEEGETSVEAEAKGVADAAAETGSEMKAKRMRREMCSGLSVLLCGQG